MTLSPGTVVGDYRILSELGGGGMATVYRVEHTALDTQHALKVLAPEYRVNEEARRRFLEEAKIQAKYLDHPGIVKVTGIVATAEVAGLVMELVEGEALDDYIAREGAQSADMIRAIMLPVLHAVSHAHDAGVIHRDIKPGNVLLARRDARLVPKLTDFGIAKVGERVDRKLTTRLAARMGTLGYMSPEQIRHAKNVTPRSDIFSLGAVLYALTTGREAFPGESEYDVMEAVIHARYQPPEAIVPGLDPTIAAVIHRALRPDPAERFADGREMSNALMPGSVQAAPVGGPRAPAQRPAASHAWVPIAVAAAAIALAAGGVGLYFATRSNDRNLDSAEVTAIAEPTAPPTPPLTRRPPRTRHVPLRINDSPTLGAADALLTAIVIADYDSASYRALYPVLEKRFHWHRDELRVAVKWFPTTKLGREAATVAARALRQGRFWSFHEALSSVPADRPLTSLDIRQAWTSTGGRITDLLEFDDQASPQIWNRTAREVTAAHINVAPSIVANGEILGGTPSDEQIKDLFERQLDEARAAIDQGVSRERLYDQLIGAIDVKK